MRTIIVGAGTIGSCVIALAVAEKDDVIVIESDPERAREVSLEHDVTVLEADATVGDTLVEAGAETADAVVVTTSDDAVNLMAVSIAVDLGVPSVVSIVNEKGHADFFRRLKANVLQNPEEVVAAHLYNAARRPQVHDLYGLPEGSQIFRLALRTRSPLAGRTAGQAMQDEKLPDTLRIVAFLRAGKQALVEEDTTLRAGDIVTFFSLERVQDDLMAKLIG